MAKLTRWTVEETELLNGFLKKGEKQRQQGLYRFWLEHFLRKGSARSYNSVEHKLRAMQRRGAPENEPPKQKMAYIDIETSHLKADFGLVLSWAIKGRGEKRVAFDHIRQRELYNGSFDYRVVRSLLQEMNKYDVFVHYYGTRFDMPYVRTKALEWNLPFPGYGQKRMFDLYYLVRSSLSLHRRRLENVTQWLGISGKTRVDPLVWKRAMYGYPDAIKAVVRHNIMDVRVLERAHKRLESFAKGILRSV